jgi:hypothetical protein
MISLYGILHCTSIMLTGQLHMNSWTSSSCCKHSGPDYLQWLPVPSTQLTFIVTFLFQLHLFYLLRWATSWPKAEWQDSLFIVARLINVYICLTAVYCAPSKLLSPYFLLETHFVAHVSNCSCFPTEIECNRRNRSCRHWKWTADTEEGLYNKGMWRH